MNNLTGVSFQYYLYQPSTNSIELCGVSVISYTEFIYGGEFGEDVPASFEFLIVCPDETIRQLGLVMEIIKSIRILYPN